MNNFSKGVTYGVLGTLFVLSTISIWLIYSYLDVIFIPSIVISIVTGLSLWGLNSNDE